MSQRRGSLLKEKVSVKVLRRSSALPVQVLRTSTGAGILGPKATSIQISFSPGASQAFASFLNLFLSARALVMLAVKMKTFGIYKPEVDALNETICHVKFISAGIKCQIT